MKDYKLPLGLYDLMPAECGEKRGVERALYRNFAAHGYLRVETPAVEYYDRFRQGFADEALFKFTDKDGSLLALRPDMTLPIARLATTKGDLNFPQKYCYVASSYSLSDGAGRDREFRQAGVEVIGAKSAFIDADLIALAAESLLVVGLRDFLIDIGHAELNCQGGVDFSLFGGEEVLSRVKGSKKAVAELEAIYKNLCGMGYKKYISFDLSGSMGADYYTGIIFKGITKFFGAPILSGGRYDKLVGPAKGGAGFAIGVRRLTEALRKCGLRTKAVAADIALGCAAGAELQAFERAKMLRQQGLSVDNTFITAKAGLEKYAKAKGIAKIEFIAKSI